MKVNFELLLFATVHAEEGCKLKRGRNRKSPKTNMEPVR